MHLTSLTLLSGITKLLILKQKSEQSELNYRDGLQQTFQLTSILGHYKHDKFALFVENTNEKIRSKKRMPA